MSARQLALVAIVFGALLLLWGGAAVVRNRGSSPDEGAGALPAVARSAVDTVRISRPRDTVLLVRRDSTAWSVNGHPASTSAVSELLEALADSTRRSEIVAQRPASHPGLGVDSAGSRLRVAGRGGVLADLVVGQRSPDLDGGYLRLAEDSVVWLVRGELAGALDRGPDDWRDRRIASVPADSVGAIEVAHARRGYTLRRTHGGWTLSPRGRADTTAAQALVGALGEIEVAGFASPAQADSARFAPADRRLRVSSPGGTPLLSLLFDSMPGGFWVRADSGGPVYRMESWTADRLTPADSAVRVR